MENLMAAQDDASPWDVPAEAAGEDEASSRQLPGRAYFSQLGVVRRKPARSDAPPTLSKSCSDKLALKQCTSLLASLTSLFVDPSNVYISTLVLPEDQYSATACHRSFSATGRMSNIVDQVTGDGYSFRPFSVATTTVQFEYSRRAVQSRSDNLTASNLAAAWTLSGVEESVLGGVIQGHKPFLPKGASSMSRRSMWQACRELAGKLPEWPAIATQLAAETYGQIKQCRLLETRSIAKARARDVALPGWIQNTGDDAFGIE
jgi:tRNA-specific adenosine deaminase 1